MTGLQIEEFDPPTASEADFRARWELVNRLNAELEPENPPTPFEPHRKELVDPPSFRRPRHWTAFDGERRPVGVATLHLEYTETNRHLSWLDLSVDPSSRRRGIGSELLRRVAAAGADDGRTILGGGTIDGSGGDAFCESLGFEKKATERKSQLAIDDVDRSMLETWVARASERAADYELFAIENRVPDDLLESFVELYKVTNTAPRDDLDMEDELLTPEQFREGEEKHLATGESSWKVVARHRATGDLAGFTELFFAPWSPERAGQGWTAVHPDHRDKGLGRWLKAANCLRLMDERPEVRHVDTWNAFSNAPMLGINIEMGFQLLRGYNDWQGATDRVAMALKERAGG